MGDDLGVERLASGDDLAQVDAMGGQILLDQHAPDGWGCAEGVDPAAVEDGEEAGCVEAALIEDEDCGAGIPGGEDVGPGVLRPAG